MQRTETCTLCLHRSCRQETGQIGVQYFRCPECGLVFIAPECRPGFDEERARYLHHNNTADDEGYVRHLMDIGDRVVSRVAAGSTGLDYGSGPVPVMSGLLRERGFRCEAYDPFFSSDRLILRRAYDFVLCCEVVEHFHDPALDFLKIFNLLNDDGLIGLKTSILEQGVDLSAWHYAKDPTHVCFYSDKTFDWITNRFRLSVEDRDAGRIVWRRSPVQNAVAVTAGIIRNGGRVLAAARNSGDLKGKWEFPGGKLNAGEEPGSGLVRELNEELGVTARTGRELARIKVPGKGGWIELCFIEAEIDEEPNILTSHSQWKWVDQSDLKGLPMPAGDRAFVDIWLEF